MIWSEGSRIPRHPVRFFILDLPQIEVQRVETAAIHTLLRPYYNWQILKTKRASSFARFRGQSLISFTHSALVKSLELYHEFFSKIPKLVLLDDVIYAALNPYLPQKLDWTLFAYDEEHYTSLCVFKDGQLVLKRRFLKQYLFMNEVRSTLKYLARHGYVGEKVMTYYLDAPHAFDPVDNIHVVQVPCDRLKVVEDGLAQLSSSQRIKKPLIPSMTEATAEEKLRHSLYRISLPLFTACALAFTFSSSFMPEPDEWMQNSYYAMSKKDEKVILFEQLSHLNVTLFDSSFLKQLKTDLGTLIPQGVQVDLKKQKMQLSIKAPDHVIAQKVIKLSKACPLFRISQDKNIVSLTYESQKESKGELS